MLNSIYLNRMKEYLGEDEYQRYLKSMEEPNIRSLRINQKYLDEQTFEKIASYNIKKIDGLDNSYFVNEEIKFGFDPIHHAGGIYLQDPSAMLPTKMVDFSNCKLVLDLCASPGGKSIDIALNLKEGILFSNEIDYKRSKVLYSNIERMGLNNVVITNNKPEDYLKNFENCFDVILVDAPCSGEGMFRKYPDALYEWSLENNIVCANRDKEILNVAYKLLKKDGLLIYSTCTFSKEEDEEIVNYLCDNYKMSLLEGNEIIKKYSKEFFQNKCYRVFPQDKFGEGQFMALLKKNEGIISTPKTIKKFDNNPIFTDFCKKNLNGVIDDIKVINNDIYYANNNYDLSSLRVLSYGAYLGEINAKRFIPNHFMFKSFSTLFKSQVNLDSSNSLVQKYLHGEEINYEAVDGYGVLFINGIPLGGYKASNNNLKNHYPKGLRNF